LNEERVEKETICPLLSIAFKVLYPCLREKCAWWGGKENCCTVRALLDFISCMESTIADGLASVAESLDAVADVLAAGD